MSRNDFRPTRVHLLGHANPITKDVNRFGFESTDEYLRFIREHLPESLRMTASKPLLDAVEDELHGGRKDDAARIRDVQSAIDDPRTLAILALNGGAYFSRILPHLDFSPLAKRRSPLWAVGFSEMTNFVNLVASYRAGRGLYWLCPNYIAWRIKPQAAARDAFAAFWRNVPSLFATNRNAPAQTSDNPAFAYSSEIHGERVAGKCESGPIRIVGGCLSVVVAMLAGPLSKRIRPDGAWLLIEDLHEQEYRVDRYLATLKLAGWFDRIAGLLVGDFHTGRFDQIPGVLELLRYHLPKSRNLPVAVAREIGHTWPMTPVPINQRLRLAVCGRQVEIA